MSRSTASSDVVDVGGDVYNAVCLRLRREDNDEWSDKVLPRLRVDGTERLADEVEEARDRSGGCCCCCCDKDVGAFGISRSGFKSCATCFTLADRLNRIFFGPECFHTHTLKQKRGEIRLQKISRSSINACCYRITSSVVAGDFEANG